MFESILLKKKENERNDSPMRTSKKIVSLVLAVLMVASMMVVGVVSVSAASVYVDNAADLITALQNNGDTVYLSNNITLGEDAIEIPAGVTVTLRLNSKTLDLNGKIIKVNATAKLSVYGAGTVTTTKKIMDNYGEAYFASSATFRTTTGNSVAMDNYDGSKMTFSGGKLYANAYGVRVYKTAKFIMNSNTSEIYTEAEAFAICGNGSAGNGGYEITISSGKVTSVNDVAIYHCNNGTLNISGGTITGATAIYVKGGATNITGGTIIGTGAKHDYDPYGNGAHPTGEAVVFEQHHSYAGLTPNGSNITGGKFQTTGEGVTTVVGSYAEANYNLTAETGFITGGTFNKPVDETLCADNFSNEQNADGTYSVANDYAASVEGTNYETFAEAVAAAGGVKDITLLRKIADPYVLTAGETLKVAKNGFTITVNAPAYYVVSSSTAGGVTTYTTAAAKIEVTKANGTVSYTNSLSLLNGDGSTVKLLDDFTTTSQINCGSSMYTDCEVTLDLNGHTLYVNSSIRNACITVLENNTLNVKNGTISMTPTSSSKDNGISVDNGSTLNLADDVTIIASGVSGVSVFDGSTLNTAANISSDNDFAIATNGTDSGNTINITGGTITSNDVAIYFPSGGDLTISDANVTGATALYVKGGNVTINSGTFTGNGNAADFTHNGNGCDATGDAIVVENCSYPNGAPQVSILGGTFESDNADAVASYAYGASNDPVEGFIAGGTYSSDVSDLCAPGLISQEISDEQFVIVAFTTDGKADIRGLQQKITGVLTGNDINTQGMRVVTEVDRAWLDEVADDYGYVVAKTTGLDQAQANFTNLKKEGGNGQKVISCVGTENNIPGYGEDYVTLAVNGMKVDDQFAARFYVVFNGVTYYANYVNTGTYTGIIGTYEDIIIG
jgi:hypothetical protein